MTNIPSDYDTTAFVVYPRKRETPQVTRQEQPKVRVFGGHAACVFEATTHSSGTPTINIEIAPKQGNTVHWQDKLIIQLIPRELPILASVLLGYTRRIELKREGKGVLIENQEKGLFVSASHPTGRYALPITPGDLYWCGDLVMAQLLAGSHSKDAESVLALVANLGQFA